MSVTTARDETESVWLSLFLTVQVLLPPPRPAGGCCHHNVFQEMFSLLRFDSALACTITIHITHRRFLGPGALAQVGNSTTHMWLVRVVVGW